MMHPAALVFPLCLQNIEESAVLSPTSPANMDGVIDSSEEPLGPIFLDHPDTIGQGNLNTNALAETGVLQLHAAPRAQTSVHFDVRTTIMVVAASYGITDHLDASLVIPVIQEDVDVHVRIGPFVGRTTFSAAGVSDLSARLKYQFHPNLALTLKAIFPTGDSSRGFGLDTYWLTPGVAASWPIGKRMQLNARAAGELDLSYLNQSGVSYGVGASALVGPVALVFEFLGSKGLQNSLSLFDVTYGDGHTFDLAFGIRAPLPHGFMVFVAGTYALDHDGIRPAGVSPVVGVGWNAMH